MIKIVSNQSVIYSEYEVINPTKALELLENLDEISLDSETEGFDPFTCNIVCLQLGNSELQLVIDNTVDLKMFKHVLETKLLIIANAQFDLRFLYYLSIFPKHVWDTQLAEMILTTGLGNEEDKRDLHKYDLKHLAERKVSLQHLANKYCKVSLDKEIRGFINREGLSTRVIQYAADDIKYLGTIKSEQIKALEIFINTYNSSWRLVELEMNAVIVFSRMLFNGFNIDKNKYNEEVLNVVSKEELKLIKTLDSYLVEIPSFFVKNATAKRAKKIPIVFTRDLYTNEVISNVNWGSPDQKLGILKALNVPVTSTGAKVLTKYSFAHPIINTLLQYNKFKKLNESFGENFLKNINKVTKRLHPSIWQILSTGRISMSEPNLAQIPSKGELGKVIRSCFIPRNEEYLIVGGDYSGFELRIIAEFSQDPLWVSTFKDGGDLHSILCSETFNIPIKDVKTPFYANPDITYRDVQKTINFGLAYGMSKYKLADTIQVSVKEADSIIKRFFSKVPKVALFLNNLGKIGKTRGYIKTAPPFGRVRLFPKWQALQQLGNIDESFRWLGEIERASMNSPIQGTNGDIIKLALIKAQEEIDINNWNVNLLLTVYDEIQSEAHISVAESWRDKLQEVMILAAEEVIKTVPIVVDVKINKHWSK